MYDNSSMPGNSMCATQRLTGEGAYGYLNRWCKGTTILQHPNLNYLFRTDHLAGWVVHLLKTLHVHVYIKV